jgi:hypothetical protein
VSILAVSGILHESVRGLGRVRLSDRERRSHRLVVAIGHALCCVSGSQLLPRAWQERFGALQLQEGFGQVLGGALQRDAQGSDVGVKLLLVTCGVSRAEGYESQAERDGESCTKTYHSHAGAMVERP